MKQMLRMTRYGITGLDLLFGFFVFLILASFAVGRISAYMFNQSLTIGVEDLIRLHNQRKELLRIDPEVKGVVGFKDLRFRPNPEGPFFYGFRYEREGHAGLGILNTTVLAQYPHPNLYRALPSEADLPQISGWIGTLKDSDMYYGAVGNLDEDPFLEKFVMDSSGRVMVECDDRKNHVNPAAVEFAASHRLEVPTPSSCLIQN